MAQIEIPILSFKDFESYMFFLPDESTFSGGDLLPPEMTDLYSLYTQVRTEKSIAIIEYGSGWSTFALVKALDENRRSYSEYVDKYLRHPNPFMLMTVDSSPEFQQIALRRITKDLFSTKVIPIISTARMTILSGQACHTFEFVPPFTADFVYLDGPSCDQVEGDVNGMTVAFGSEAYLYGLPMAADPILLEAFYWPGTLIVTDGRGANAYFLRNNFKRGWTYRYDKDHDQHIFKLNETPWGGISEALLKLKGI